MRRDDIIAALVLAFALGMLAGASIAHAAPRPAARVIPAAPMGVARPDLEPRTGAPVDSDVAQHQSAVIPVIGATEVVGANPAVGANAGAPSATPRPTTRPKSGRRGVATWFAAPEGTAAAGPALRAFIGHGWRGDLVRVTGPSGSVVVRLTDWMRADRLVDLNPSAFTAACGRLSRGVCRVRVVRA